MSGHTFHSTTISPAQVCEVRAHLKAVARVLHQRASSGLSGAHSRRLRRFAELLTDATPGILAVLEQQTLNVPDPSARPTSPLFEVHR
jgi:hypothetical protein